MSDLIAVNQDIATVEKPWMSYIVLEAESGLLPEIYDALDFIWENEEGRSLIKSAAQRHGHIIIKYSDDVKECGVGKANDIISLNQDFKYSHYVTDTGESYPFSLRRTIAHELEHTLQDGLTSDHAKAIKAYELDLQISGRLQDHYFLDAIFFDRLVHDAGFSDITDPGKFVVEFQQLFAGETVKNAWNAHIDRQILQWNAVIEGNAGFKEFVAEIEKPAIERANAVMAGTEPPRSTAYCEIITKKINSLEKIRDKPMQFALKGAATMQKIIEAGGVQTFLETTHDRYMAEVEEAGLPKTILMENPHYCGVVTGLTCNIDLPGRS